MIEVKEGASGYSPTTWLTLKGMGELGAGELIKISMGETVICGRSRHCDWSLKRAPAWLKSEGEERDEIQRSLEFRSVSRRHLRITFLAEDMVELENLSANGTFLDGNRVDRIVLKDCTQRTHIIRLGPAGVTLELTPGSLPAGLQADSKSEPAATEEPSTDE